MLRKLLTAVCVAALLLPAATSLAAEDPQQELDDVQRQIEERQGSISEIDGQRTVTLGDLTRIDGQIAVLDANLADLRAELAGAEGDLQAAELRLASTTSELVATGERLRLARKQLQDERKTFADRTRASFMHGGATSMLGMTLDAGDIADFGRAVVYVERVMATDRDRVTRMSGLAREIEADTVELGVLRDRQAGERQAAEGERDRVAGLVATEEELRTAAETERGKRQVVLLQLDADRDSHQQMVAQLEAESERLEEELRRLAEEEERRRQEEEERRRQEEERRRQEEERRRQDEQRQREERERQLASRSAAGSSQRSSQQGSSEQGSSQQGSSQQGSSQAAQPPASSGQMQRPAGGRLTSGYGWRTHPIFGNRRFHSGVDFGGGHGAPIYAAEAGVVVSASNRGGYGMTVVLDHGGGLSTLYAHQSRFAVSAGQRVSRGQVIGYIGSTGYSTGPHLHFEVRVNGATRNPMDYL